MQDHKDIHSLHAPQPPPLSAPPLPPPQQHQQQQHLHPQPSLRSPFLSTHPPRHRHEEQHADSYPIPPPLTPDQILSTPQQASPTNAPPQSANRLDGQKAFRLRKACDSCSIRKVKCDESGPPCKACLALDIPCTFDRPSRRRGPPNRHAEAIKRQKLAQPPDQSNAVPASASSLTPSPYEHPTASPLHLTAESIAPLELIVFLIDDYFTYVHALTPFPHETWFRQAFAQRRDLHDRSFVALLAGMLGALVSSFPRRPLKRIKHLNLGHVFPNALSLVRKCQQVVHEARGIGYLSRPDLHVYDAATCYFMLCMHAFTYDIALGNLYLGECYNVLRVLDQYRTPTNPSEPVNYIEQEMARRLYWTVFVTVTSSRYIGLAVEEPCMHLETPSSPHPPLPLEVDDRYIFPDHVESQLRDIVPRIAGFNINVRIYLTCDPLRAAELSWGIRRTFDWSLHKSVLQSCLANIKSMPSTMPETFSVWRGIPSPSSPSSGTSSLSSLHDPPPDTARIGPDFIDDEATRSITYEVQKANIHASLLSTRSYLAERYHSLCETDPARSPSTNAFASTSPAHDIKLERESIASDLLAVLASIRPAHMEPNCMPFCMKIRQIAATLLPAGGEAPPDADPRARYYLQSFMEILADVEKSGARGGGAAERGADAEEEELRRWADLRECQRAFVEGDGGLVRHGRG